MARPISRDNDFNGGAPPRPIVRVPFLDLRRRATGDENRPPLPTLIPSADFERAYGPFQVLHVRGCAPARRPCPSPSPEPRPATFRAGDVRALFGSLDDEDRASWCVENWADRAQDDDGGGDATPNDFLDVDERGRRGYCSFLVQSSEEAMGDLLSKRLPVASLPVESSVKVRQAPCLWLFFGKNYAGGGGPSPTVLRGRPEHTDSVLHDGTWHYQLSGTKIWRLRPTTELVRWVRGLEKHKNQLSGHRRKIDGASGEPMHENDETHDDVNGDTYKGYVEVECKQGDIILLNTRLWWHSTTIPPQEVPCVSYARDIYLLNSGMSTGARDGAPQSCNTDGYGGGSREDGAVNRQRSYMTNVDCTYATEDIEAGTILFTEHDMPDCELHRSKTNPNSQVAELEDEETGESCMAVVSLRAIRAGELICVMESDEEGWSGSDQEDEEGIE